MKLLIITPFLPYPDAMSGAPRAIYDRLQLISDRHDVTVLSLIAPDERVHLSKLRALNIQLHVVEHRLADQSLRDIWLKRVRLARGIVTDPRPMLVQEFGSSRMEKKLSRLLDEHRFDLVLAEHILAAQYIRGLRRRSVPVVMSEHDPRAAFHDRSSIGLNTILSAPFRKLDRLKWQRYAETAYRRAALVLVPTSEDATLLREFTPEARVRVVPYSIAQAGTRGDTFPEKVERERNTLLFVGNFDHLPNRDAAVWLCREIMPLVWRVRHEVDVWLVGKNPTLEITALASHRVTVTGEVPSVASYLRRCTLFVAPLRLGGGMRIKLLEAMSEATPVVTTSVGAQGLDARAGVHLLVADDAENMASTIVGALDDPALREKLRMAGYHLVTGGSADERAAKLDGILSSVLRQRSAGMGVGISSNRERSRK